MSIICALQPTPEGQNILILSRQGQNFKMITSAKHEGYISLWARVRSTRVPNIIHHEGRGCNAYIKTSGIYPLDKRDISLNRYYDIFEILSLPVQNYNFLSLWHRWKDRDRV